MSKRNIIEAALLTPMPGDRWGLPLLLLGGPGIAKTATIEAIGRAFGVHCETLSPGERGEGAFGVVPVPRKSTSGADVIGYPAPEWAENLSTKNGEVGLIFVDEITTAAPALQSALLGLIQNRRIGGHTFGPRVRVLGAANPPNQAAGGWDLAAPVANRLGHIEWPAPSINEWAGYMSGAGVASESRDLEKEESRVLREWPKAYAKAVGLATAFLRRRPELHYKKPADNDPSCGGAWPSPRTWEYATRAMASAEIHELSNVDRDDFVAAFVGTAAAAEFLTWVESADLPDPVEVLDGKVEFKHNPERIDRTEAVLSACAALVVPKNSAKRTERAGALWRLCETVAEDAVDIVLPSMGQLAASGLGFGHAEGKRVLQRKHIADAIRDSGLIDAAKARR